MTENKGEKKFTTGQVANLVGGGIKLATIHRWRQAKYVTPHEIRVANGRVYLFSQNDVDRIARMWRLVSDPEHPLAPRKAFEKTRPAQVVPAGHDLKALDKLRVNTRAWNRFTSEVKQSINDAAALAQGSFDSFVHLLFDSPHVRALVAGFIIQPNFTIDQKLDLLTSLTILRPDAPSSRS